MINFFKKFISFLFGSAKSPEAVKMVVLSTPQNGSVEPPKEPILPPISPAKSLVLTTNPLETFCLAIRDFEGKPGDHNYRLNNPGNVRCSPVGYLAKYGKVTCVNNFACFESYELGWEYLKALVSTLAHLHPQWTIQDFFANYAPPTDSNPTVAYARYVATRCGATPSTTLSQLLT